MRKFLASLLLAAGLGACTPDLVDQAERGGLIRREMDGGPFHLTTWRRPGRPPDGALTVYIEGDGMAFLRSGWPSSDPTPSQPIALALALADRRPGVLALERPCQFAGRDDPTCTAAYWSEARFAPEVIDSADRVIGAALTESGANRLILVGYSGGGVVAALVAARHPGITTLVTIAAPLDTAGWTTLHEVPPLERSLGPLEFADHLRDVPQLHFVGADDEVVPRTVVDTYLATVAPTCSHLVVVPDFDHQCCWARLDWRQELARLACRSEKL